MIGDLAPGTRVVLLDIEGTTTPIAFVHERLFAYARARLNDYLAAHWHDADVRRAVAWLAREHEADRHAAPAWHDGDEAAARTSVGDYTRWLMDRDRKSPGLKLLQGLIWDDGYRAGVLRGDVWPDVPAAMRRWRDAGRVIAIYSSGSELAQRRLFASTPHGDLTPLIDAFFDTGVGPKVSAESYRRIATALAVEPDAICFVSDVTAELVAARAAGCATILAVRPGNPPQPHVGDFPCITTFDDL